MNRAVTTFWNTRNAEEFDAIAHNSGRMAALHRVSTLSKPALSHEGATSIDLGCGTGLFAGVVGVRSRIGIDFSEALLASARERMETVLQHDIFDLPFAACSIDTIVSLFVIDDYPSEKKAIFFTTVFSLLKPGGNFFFAAYSPHDERMGVWHGFSTDKHRRALRSILRTFHPISGGSSGVVWCWVRPRSSPRMVCFRWVPKERSSGENSLSWWGRRNEL